MKSESIPQTDEAWLRAFLTDDTAACRLIERWAEEIVRCRHFYFDNHEVMDLVQDTVISVWRICSKDGFQLEGSLRPLVRRIASARCIDRLRRRRPNLELDEQQADPRPSPYDVLEKADREHALRLAIQSLRPACRDLIRWRTIDEVSYADIADRLGCAEATARVKMFQCIGKIRRFLQNRGFLE